MSLTELSKLHMRISMARGPEELFSTLAALRHRHQDAQGLEDEADPTFALEEEYLAFSRIADPDRYVGDPHAQSTARAILTRLYDFHRQALSIVDAYPLDAQTRESGVDKRASAPRVGNAAPPPPSPRDAGGAASEISADVPGFAVLTRSGSYEALGVWAHGELSTVYHGRSLARPEAAKPPVKLVLKVAYEPSDNDLLLDEVRTLRLFEGVQSPQRKHLPELVDQFQTPDGRVGTILRFIKGHTLAAIRDRYPQGIPGQHAVWILSRLLSGLGFAHSRGIIHGNVEPAHILVQPAEHNVVLIDWSYSIVAPAQSGQGFKVHNPDYSPIEVAERKPPIPASDLYSLGKCMIFLLGGNLEHDSLPDTVDDRLARFVQFFVRKSPRQRAQDAWEMHERLKTLREEIYGPHQFLKFDM